MYLHLTLSQHVKNNFMSCLILIIPKNIFILFCTIFFVCLLIILYMGKYPFGIPVFLDGSLGDINLTLYPFTLLFKIHL